MSADALELHQDRYFDPDPTVRRAARELYAEASGLPLLCPHGHVDARILAEDAPFPEPTSLIVTPDHYILRMLYSRGVPLEALGVARRDGGDVERNPRAAWRRFAEHWYLFRGTPTAAWLDYELAVVFGVRTRLGAETADRVYDEIAERLTSPEFRPRALFERFRIEVLATTDGASDSLVHHRAIRESGWKGRVIPTFRPDRVLAIAEREWRGELVALERATGKTIDSADDFVRALAERRAFFRELGATATDHGVEQPLTMRLAADDVDAMFDRARSGDATKDDERRFVAHMLIEMARLSTEDGLVMQLHAGVFRDYDSLLFERFGRDRGGDIPLRSEFTRNLHPLLEAHGNDPRLTLILFTLDDATYARELAPLAGHYPAVRLGPAWWFHDSIEGMMRFRQRTTETAGIYNTVGFNDDTRAFCSIPARHDLARRVDANYLGGLVARHVVSMAEARAMMRALAYELARDGYRLGDERSVASGVDARAVRA